MMSDADQEPQPAERELQPVEREPEWERTEEAGEIEEQGSGRSGRKEMVALLLLLLIIFAGVMYADVIDPSEAWKSEWTYDEATDPFTDVVTAHAVLPSVDGGIEEAGIYARCSTGKPILAAIHDHNPNSIVQVEVMPENVLTVRFDRQQPFYMKLPLTGELGTRSETFLGLLERSRKMVMRYRGAFGHAEFDLAGTRSVVAQLRRACLPPGARPAATTNPIQRIGTSVTSFFNSLR
jgi:hypothetical protein